MYYDLVASNHHFRQSDHKPGCLHVASLQKKATCPVVHDPVKKAEYPKKLKRGARFYNAAIKEYLTKN
jgi:hypothetical protein